MGVTVTITEDRVAYDALRRRLKSMDNLGIEAGLHDAEQAQKAAWHEFGTSDLPARPWAGNAADAAREQLGDMAGEAVGQVADGSTARKALKPLAESTADRLSKTIERGHVGGPALRPSTVAGKGHAVKLIDTGKMLRSIKGKVVRDAGGGEL